MPSVYRINGTVSNATGTNLTALSVTTAYTFAWWSKGPPVQGDVFRHSSTANANRDGYHIIMGSSGIVARHCTATASTNYQIISGRRGSDRIWKHYAIAFTGGVAQGYINGIQMSRVAVALTPTANAACTTSFNSDSGSAVDYLFDVQIIGVQVAEQDIRLLMDPTYKHPNLIAKYFGREFVGVGASSTLRDESGNGNNMTTSASGRLDIDAEPPIRPTFA